MFYLQNGFENADERGRQLGHVTENSLERFATVAPIRSNNIQQPIQYKVISQSLINRLQAAGLLQAPQQQTQPETIQYEGNSERRKPTVIGQIYSFRSPGPQLQYVESRPSSEESYKKIKAQIFKVTTESYTPDVGLQKPVIQTSKTQNQYAFKPYFSHLNADNYNTKIQNVPQIKNQPTYIKQEPDDYVGKYYQIQIPYKPTYAPRPLALDKIKYTAAKLYRSSTQTPYINKVKFELEDARIPQIEQQNIYKLHEIKVVNSNNNIRNGFQIDSKPVTPSPYFQKISTPQTPKKQFYYIQPAAQIVNTDDEKEILPLPDRENTRPEVNTVTPSEEQVLDPYDHRVNPEPNVVEYDGAVENVLSILKQTNKLPQAFTPENIDGSIRTLALLLERLQQKEKKFKSQPQYTKVTSIPPTVAPTQQTPMDGEAYRNGAKIFPESSGTSTPGRPGLDYPIYSTIPQTSFDCATQRYKGFFGDPDTNCQVWHYCDLNGGQASFLCPNGTIFSQVALTCDWWFNVRCASTPQLYVLNERLYKYILPFSPSFPEDYSGPLVDRYLAARYKEMEAKSRIKALKALISTPKEQTTTVTQENNVTNS